MPIYKTIAVNPHTKLLIWKIEEPFDTLAQDILLTPRCSYRLSHMKSEIHRRGFLSVRQLLKVLGYTAADLYYDKEGKPHLTDGKQISISHSFQFAGVVISDWPVGIDIEMQRDKIQRIAHKFTTVEDYANLSDSALFIRKLTMVWCAKEALYKIYATPGLSFLQHIVIADFDMETLQTTGDIIYEGKTTTYSIFFSEFDGFTCAYAYPL